MKRILVGVLALVLSLQAWAAGPASVRDNVEVSTLLTGSIVVGPEGQVAEYAIDQPEKIGSGILDLVKANVGRWAFQPTLMDGTPVRVRNKMHIRIIANPREGGDFAVRLGGVGFFPFKEEEGGQLASLKMTPPRYPVSAARAGAGATVYLALKVGRDGSVQDVIAEQVNLPFVSAENTMKHIRKVFADASIQAARQWKFAPPVKGDDVHAAYWTLRVPVDYAMGSSKKDLQYGEWEAYVPGPRLPVPWEDLRDLPSFAPDSMVANGDFYQTGKGVRLLTPLQGS